MLLTIVAAIFVLGLLIFAHELGHFLAMRRAKVKVETFSFGFGPRLAGFKRGETDFVISALPFGGYVKPAGENPDEEGLSGAPWEFLSKPWWSRALIFASGPVTNILLALILNSLLGMIGLKVSDYPTTIGKVETASPAEKAGFRVGDEILAFVPKETPAETSGVRSWHQLMLTQKPEGTVTIRRGSQVMPLPVKGTKEKPWFEGLDPTIPPEVGGVSVGMPAYQAGLKVGDRIVAIDGVAVQTWYETSDIIHKRPNQKIALQIERNGQKLGISLVPVSQDIPGLGTVGLIGIQPPETGSYIVRLNPIASVAGGTAFTGQTIVGTYAGLWKMATHPTLARQGLGGPIMIAQMSGQEARAGWDRLLSFMAILSIALAVLNFLPVPVLDGGHIFFCLIEGLRRRPLSIRSQVRLQKVGIVLLILLVAFTSFNDISRYVQRQWAIHQQQ